MSFLGELRRELGRVGIRGTRASRIEAELADHLACDPEASLGAPADIAERFAAELRVVRTRRASLVTFAALVLCAVLPLGIAGRNVSTPQPALGLAMVILAQVAFVAGALALLGVRARTAGQLRLAQRRSSVALLAGAGFCVAAVVRGPDSWPAVVALLPLVPVAVALVRTRAAAALTPPAATAPEIPAWGWTALGAIAVSGAFMQGLVFEGDLVEGLIRAGLEAAGLLAAVVVLGRPLGLRA